LHKDAYSDGTAVPKTLDLLKRSMYSCVAWNEPLGEAEQKMRDL